ncbi:MAG: protein kinase [Deltaproteobacteria bacterium]|nr:protein kinase [Deltaproteobacteria bacterium]
MKQQPPSECGRYLLHDRLGWGGPLGTWRASSKEDPLDLAALKLLSPSSDGDDVALDALISENRLAERLTHPNVVRVKGQGCSEEYFYVAMEYAAGVDLGAVLRRGLERDRYLPVPLAVALVAQLCDGLEQVHRCVGVEGLPLGLVHRGLSPETCLVTFDGVVKLFDFGVAKLVTRVFQVPAGAVTRQLCYSSPEQVLGQPLDRRSDLFSLSVMLYELVTGQRLFPAASAFQAVKDVCEKPIPSPRSLNPHVSDELERVILRGLSRDRQGRFQGASELAEALRAAASGITPAPSMGLVQRYMTFTFGAELEAERRWRQEWSDKSILASPLPKSQLSMPPLSSGAMRSPRLGQPENRSWRRWSVEIPAMGKYSEPRGIAPRALEATLLNISQGGMLLRSKVMVTANSLVELALKIGRKTVEIRGKVRWWRRVHSEYQVGVQFERLQPELVETLSPGSKT